MTSRFWLWASWFSANLPRWTSWNFGLVFLCVIKPLIIALFRASRILSRQVKNQITRPEGASWVQILSYTLQIKGFKIKLGLAVVFQLTSLLVGYFCPRISKIDICSISRWRFYNSIFADFSESFCKSFNQTAKSINITVIIQSARIFELNNNISNPL